MLGGSVGLLIKSMMGIYILLLFNNLVFNLDDDNSSVVWRQNLEDLGAVNFNETEMMAFLSIMNSTTG